MADVFKELSGDVARPARGAANDDVDLAVEPDFRLGALEVSPSACRARADERETRVEPRVMQVLVVLSRRQGETVTRDQLVQACWGGRAVTDDAVNRVLAQVRSIARSYEPPPFTLETVPKVGVRLVARQASAQAAIAAEARWRWRRFAAPATLAVAALLVVAALATWRARVPPETPVLAVLPFANTSGDPALGELGDGIAGDVQAILSQGRVGLTLVGAAASSQLRGRDQSPTIVRRRLGATHAIVGSIERVGARIHILAQLVDTRTGDVLWSDTSDRDSGDLLDVQHDVARRTALVLHYAAPELAKPARGVTPQALENWLHAVEIMRAGGVYGPATDDAIPSLEAATQEAPAFARAWAFLAMAYQIHSRFLDESGQAQWAARARAAAMKAIELDPSLGFPHIVLAALEPEWNWDRRLAEVARAEALSPDDIDVIRYRIEMSHRMGRMADMRAGYQRAFQLDPISPDVRDWQWQDLMAQDRRAEAEAALRRFAAEDPDARPNWMYFIELSLQAGDRAAAERGLAEFERDLPSIKVARGWGDAKASQVLAEARRTVADGARPSSPAARQNAAEAQFRALQASSGQGCATDVLEDLADPEASRLDLAWQVVEELYIRRGYARPSADCKHSVYMDREAATWPLFDPETASLRHDPRIWRTFAAVGLAQHWLRAGDWPDFCREPGLPYTCRTEALKASAGAS